MAKSKSKFNKRLEKLESITRPEVKYQVGESGAFDTVGSVLGTLLTP